MPTPFDDDYPDLDAVCTVLADAVAREVLAALDGAATADEITEATDLAPSTVYDKLEALEEAGLVEGTMRVREDGNHETVYTADAERIVFDRSDDGSLSVDIERPDRSASERLVDVWSEVRRS